MASKKARGIRKKTRHKISGKGSKVTVNRLLQEIPQGTSVDIKIDASIHSGMPQSRYHGYTGKVEGKQGRAYIVSASKGNKKVSLIIGPAHLHVSKGSGKQVKVSAPKPKVKAAEFNPKSKAVESGKVKAAEPKPKPENAGAGNGKEDSEAVKVVA
ncbi:MAG TPA: hypothetical protein VFF09_05195 [archaeon]|nr:hypothetical protein [archaeon]